MGRFSRDRCRIPMKIIVCVDHNDSPQKSTVSVSQLLRGERWVHHHQGRSPSDDRTNRIRRCVPRAIPGIHP